MAGDAATLTTLSTALRHAPSPTGLFSPWLETPYEGTNIIINITSNDGGSTGKGILIGMLSAIGSAAFVVLIFAIFYFFRHTSRGRIFLDRIGRPGEFDDEQALAREEAEALESMDDHQRFEYLKAKGRENMKLQSFGFILALLTFTCSSSLYTSKSTRNYADRHFALPIFSNSREGCLRMGIRTGT